MDHLHVTEFGSDRYLVKLNQAAQAANATPATASASTEIAQTQSPFILPIRGYNPESEDPATKNNESRRPEKRSFLGFRSKFHSKDSKGPPASGHTTELAYHDRRPSVASTTKQRLVPENMIV